MNSASNKTQILQGHSRPIKDVRFSYDGVYIFSGSSDRQIVRWSIQTGEKMNTYLHLAAVNVFTLTKNGSYMISGDSTGCVYLWEVTTGALLKQIQFSPTFCVRSIELSTDDYFIIITYAGRSKGSLSFFNVYRLMDIVEYQEEESLDKVEDKQEEEEEFFDTFRSEKKDKEEKKTSVTQQTIIIPETSTKLTPFKTIECLNKETKYMQAKFTNLNKSVLVSREDGALELINFNNGKIITESKFHDDTILDFDVNSDKGIILTASRDGYSMVINIDTFQVINKFHPLNPTRNLNACKIAVIENPDYCESQETNIVIDVNNLFNFSNDQLFSSNLLQSSQSPFGKKEKEILIAIISGGQDSKLVTTTNQREGGFEIIIYHAINGNEVSNFLVHFGPVNALAVMGNLLASGAEDATVRIHKLENYLFPIDKNK